MKALSALFVMILMSSAASAAPRCLDLTARQAARAVAFMKISAHEKVPLIIHSTKERGIIQPMGIWAEKKAGLQGRKKYRIRVDGREVDISLIYAARSAQHREAWNVGWLVGCRPAPGKPVSLRF